MTQTQSGGAATTHSNPARKTGHPPRDSIRGEDSAPGSVPAARPAGRFPWEKALREDTSIPWHARALGLLLATYADGPDGEDGANIHPGIDRLATETGQAEKTVRRQLNQLRDTGWITRTKRTNKRRGNADVYRLTVPDQVPQETHDGGSSGERPYRSPMTGTEGGGERPYRSPVSSVPVTHDHPPTQGPTQQNTPLRGVARTREPRRPATLVPEDFTVTPQLQAWAVEHAPDVNLPWETDKFLDHWRADASTRAWKRDWVAAWRNWMRKAQQDADERARRAQRWHKPTTDDRIREFLAGSDVDHPPTVANGPNLYAVPGGDR